MKWQEVELEDGRIVTIRPLLEKDRGRLFEMFSSMSKKALRWSMAPYTESVIERWMNNLPNLIALLAEWCDSIIGYSAVFKHTHPRQKGIGDMGIYLHQDFQRVGLGSTMVELVVDLAGREGLHRLTLHVVSENTGAIRLYEKLGFTVEGRMRDAFFGTDEQYHDMLVMGRILDRSSD